MNTPNSGIYRWMIFKDEEGAWVGVALEFNIVVTGEDPRLVEIELQEAVLGYLESAKMVTGGFRTGQVNVVLNQEAEEEYESRWQEMQSQSRAAPRPDVPSPFADIYKAGVASLANV